MSNQFHNRLVGTIVVVALGVIFLPDMLDGKKERMQEEFTEIPLRPAIVETESQSRNFEVLPAAKEKTSVEDKSNTQTKTLNNDTSKDSSSKELKNQPLNSSETQKKVKNNNDDQVISTAWTVQLGTFKDADNAELLITKLRQKGYQAYSLPKKPKHGTLTKVFVGPNISKEKITQLRSEVESLTKLKTKIVPFDPLET